MFPFDFVVHDGGQDFDEQDAQAHEDEEVVDPAGSGTLRTVRLPNEIRDAGCRPCGHLRLIPSHSTATPPSTLWSLLRLDVCVVLSGAATQYSCNLPCHHRRLEVQPKRFDPHGQSVLPSMASPLGTKTEGTLEPVPTTAGAALKAQTSEAVATQAQTSQAVATQAQTCHALASRATTAQAMATRAPTAQAVTNQPPRAVPIARVAPAMAAELVGPPVPRQRRYRVRP